QLPLIITFSGLYRGIIHKGRAVAFYTQGIFIVSFSLLTTSLSSHIEEGLFLKLNMWCKCVHRKPSAEEEKYTLKRMDYHDTGGLFIGEFNISQE
ncbi:MAG TPA: hypothetical protein PLA74_05210, partial [Syntrophales bacterium]|nr:hypothetical protein [Syntrophales bacterium]